MLKSRIASIILSQANFLTSYLIILFFAFHLSVSEFGVLTYLKNIIALSLIFINFGLDRSSLFLFKENPLLMYPYANTVKLILYIVVLITFISLYLLSYINASLSLLVIILFLPLFLVFDIKYLFDIGNKIQLEVVLSYLKVVPLLLFIAIYFYSDLHIETIDYFLYLLVGLFLYTFAQYYFLKINPVIYFNTEKLKKIIKYSSFVWIGAIASSINNYIDSFMIMNILGKEMTGIYNFAYTFYTGLLLITSLLVRFFIAETLNSNITLKEVHFYSLKMFALSLFIFFAAYFIYPFFIKIFYQNYTKSVDVFHILSLSFVLVSVTSIYGNMLISKGKSNYFSLTMGLVALSNFLLNYVFIPIYGINGAALVTLASTLLAVMLTYYFFRTKVLT